MGASNEQVSNIKRVWISILAGLGAAFVGFFAGVILSGFLIFLFFSIFGTFTEVGPLMVLYVSPVIGGITAVIVGIRSEIKAYKHKPDFSKQ